jgi:hypothetical protein
MEKTRELQVRQAAAPHLSGIPARQNAASIELLLTQIAYEEMLSRFGADEIDRCDRLSA